MTKSAPLQAWLVALALFALVGVAPSAKSEPAGARNGREILVMLRLSPDHFRPDGGYAGDDYGDPVAHAQQRRAAEQIARRHGLSLAEDGWPMPMLRVDCFVMRVPETRSVDDAVADVSKDPAVAWSQPVQVFQARGGDNLGADPLLPVQPAERAWRLTELHRFATGRGVSVAVVDSRIDVGHPDLSGQFIADQDFVSGHPGPAERHGTGVAGVIAAKANNGIGIAGVAPRARLMALRACWQTGASQTAPTVCDSLSLARAIQFAIDHRAGVINLSLAGPPDRLFGELLDIALERGIPVVAAYDPTLPGGGFPAAKLGIIPVALDSLATFPPGVYGAPGQDVPTTQPGGKWVLVNGSSYSAAHISGLIALVRERRALPLRLVSVAGRTSGGPIDAYATLLGGKTFACAGPAKVDC